MTTMITTNNESTNNNNHTNTDINATTSYIYLPKSCQSTIPLTLKWKVNSGSIVRKGEFIALGYTATATSIISSSGENITSSTAATSSLSKENENSSSSNDTNNDTDSTVTEEEEKVVIENTTTTTTTTNKSESDSIITTKNKTDVDSPTTSIKTSEETAIDKNTTEKLSSRQLLRRRMKLKQQKEEEQQFSKENSNGSSIKVMSPADGILEIYEMNNNSSATANDGSVVMKLGHVEPCTHTTIYAGLCAICGIALKPNDTTSDQEATPKPSRKNTFMSRFTLSNGLVTTTMSNTKEALQITNQHLNLLKEKKKLFLILDLDHTLVHATADIRALPLLQKDPEGDVILNSIRSLCLPLTETTSTNNAQINLARHTIKLRPYLKEFLNNLSPLYEIGIYTAGTRGYANKVTQVICRYMIGMQEDEDDLFCIENEIRFLEGYVRDLQRKLLTLYVDCDDDKGMSVDNRSTTALVVGDGDHVVKEETLLSTNEAGKEDTEMVVTNQNTESNQEENTAATPVTTTSNDENNSTDETTTPTSIEEKAMKLLIKVPSGKKAGDEISFTNPRIAGQRLKVKIPENTTSGERIIVSVPSPHKSALKQKSPVIKSALKHKVVVAKSLSNDLPIKETTQKQITAGKVVSLNNDIIQPDKLLNFIQEPNVSFQNKFNTTEKFLVLEEHDHDDIDMDKDKDKDKSTTNTSQSEEELDNNKSLDSNKRKQLTSEGENENTLNTTTSDYKPIPKKQKKKHVSFNLPQNPSNQSIQTILRFTKQKLLTLQTKYKLIIEQNKQALTLHKKLFGSRIISRTETIQDGLHRDIKSIRRFFPSGNRDMCAIIDDREDVWANCIDNHDTPSGEPPVNLLWCKPYHWRRFMGFADVNILSNTVERKNEVGGAVPLKKDVIEENDDCQLLYTCNMLQKLHSDYYNTTPESSVQEENRPTHVNEILQKIRKNVLGSPNHNVTIVFSGLVPLHIQNQNTTTKKARPSVVRYAQDLGANVISSLDESVTHIVAARDGTDKITRARNFFPRICVVNVSWLMECYWSMQYCDVTPHLILPQPFAVLQMDDKKGGIATTTNGHGKIDSNVMNEKNTTITSTTTINENKDDDSNNNSLKKKERIKILIEDEDEDDNEDDDDSNDDDDDALMLDLEMEMMSTSNN